MVEFSEFLDADPGGAENLDEGPRPEGVVVFSCQVPALAGAQVADPDPVGCPAVAAFSLQRGVPVGDGRSGVGLACGLQQALSVMTVIRDLGDEGR